MEIILQEVCSDRPDSTQILFSSPIACNRVKTILIWEKSDFAWKYSPNFFVSQSTFNTPSIVKLTAESGYVTIQLSDFKKDLNLLQEIKQLINGLVSEGASCKMVVS